MSRTLFVPIWRDCDEKSGNPRSHAIHYTQGTPTEYNSKRPGTKTKAKAHKMPKKGRRIWPKMWPRSRGFWGRSNVNRCNGMWFPCSEFSSWKSLHYSFKRNCFFLKLIAHRFHPFCHRIAVKMCLKSAYLRRVSLNIIWKTIFSSNSKFLAETQEGSHPMYSNVAIDQIL